MDGAWDSIKWAISSLLQMKSASSAYTIMSARRSWRTSRRSAKSRRTASRYTTKRTGESESPRGVPVLLSNGVSRWLSSRSASLVSRSSSRISRSSSSSTISSSTESSLSRLTVSKARERSIQGCGTFTCIVECVLLSTCEPILLRLGRNPLWCGDRKRSTFGEIRFSTTSEIALRMLLRSTMGRRLAH